MAPEDGYWRFCDMLERHNVTTPIITTPPETERVVLEQHTGTGKYRFRPFDEIANEAGKR